VQVITAMRLIRQLGVAPRRTIRFNLLQTGFQLVDEIQAGHAV
jgi:hypothetical protein